MPESGSQTVYLLTPPETGTIRPWPPGGCPDEFLFIWTTTPIRRKHHNYHQGFAWLLREKRHWDTVIALTDFDVEKATAIRRTNSASPDGPQTTGRYYRDKLGHAPAAQDAGISVPAVHLPFSTTRPSVNSRNWFPAPWVLKPPF